MCGAVFSTGIPLANPVIARRRAVAFTSVVACQLAQTLEMGRTEGRLSPEVLGAVAASGAFVLAAQMLPPFQRFFGLALPGPAGLMVCGAAILGSLIISRVLSASDDLTPSTN